MMVAMLFMTLMITGSIEARPESSFDRVMMSYEQIRLELADDSLKGVSQNAENIVAELQHLRRNITAADAGVDRGDGMVVFSELETWTETARTLQNADSLAGARDSFQNLSEMLIGWRDRQILSSGAIVASCPSTQETWLQAKKSRKEINSPFACSHSDECEKIVSR